jgi:shikimate dehydrogenase
VTTRRPLDTQIRNGLFGVVGHRIQYSQSPAIFRRVFGALGWPALYALYDLAPARFARFASEAAHGDIVGFNVTQPYKVRIVEHLGRLDSSARAVGAVNTVSCRRRGLTGYNTDVDGVEIALAPYRRKLRGAPVLILGCGGAARAVAVALFRRFRAGQITFAVRSAKKGRGVIRELRKNTGTCWPMEICPFATASLRGILPETKLLVNATPVGGGTLKRETPLPCALSLPPGLIAFDLIYRPSPTRFLREARRAGCKTVGGWPMLVGQAEAAFRIWTGRGFPVKTRRELMAQGKSA